MPSVQTLLWYFLGAMALIVLYLKKGLIIAEIRERLAFQRQYKDIEKEAYHEEKLKQAKVQGVLKARQPGILSGVGTNIQKMAAQNIKVETPKKKKKKKKEEPQRIQEETPKSNIEKLMGF